MQKTKRFIYVVVLCNVIILDEFKHRIVCYSICFIIEKGKLKKKRTQNKEKISKVIIMVIIIIIIIRKTSVSGNSVVHR